MPNYDVVSTKEKKTRNGKWNGSAGRKGDLGIEEDGLPQGNENHHHV